MIVGRLNLPADDPLLLAMKGRCDIALGTIDDFAGREFITADIMIVFSLTAMRLFLPHGLAPYPAILACLQRIGGRPAENCRGPRSVRNLESALLTKSVVLTYMC